jgi:hypothetical protein
MRLHKEEVTASHPAPKGFTGQAIESVPLRGVALLHSGSGGNIAFCVLEIGDEPVAPGEV